MWPVSFIAPIVLLGYGAFRLLQKYLQWMYSPLRKVPGPPLNNFVLGYFLEIRKEPFMTPAIKWWKEAGYDVPMLHVTAFMGSSSLYILDKNIVKKILTAPSGTSDYRFAKGLDFISSKVGHGLLTLDGEQWMRHRRIVQSAFHTNFLKESLSESVVPRILNFIQYWRMAIKNNSVQESQVREIDLNSHLSALTLDIMGDVLFSHEFNAIASVKVWAESGGDCFDKSEHTLVSSISNALQLTVLGSIFFLANWAWGDKNLNPKSKRHRKRMDQELDNIIENARRSNSNGKPKSLLQLLLRASSTDGNKILPKKGTNGTLSTSELREEMVLFMIAGHETTSTLCYWAIYVLCKYPDVQEKVYKEIEGAKDLDLDTVEGLIYFDAFLNEVQRYFPPAGFLRRVNRFEEDFAGFTIPAKTRIVIPTYMLHRHPKYWDDPESFLPERWIHKDDEARQQFLNRTRFAFLPFSAGGRNCVGQHFAMIETKLILAHLVRAFSFQTAPSQVNTDFTLTSYITLKSKPLVKVSLKCRD